LISQVFGGSPASLVLHLVETGDLTEDDLREVRQQVNARAEALKAAEASSDAAGKQGARKGGGK
jgi:hypothetical protein